MSESARGFARHAPLRLTLQGRDLTAVAAPVNCVQILDDPEYLAVFLVVAGEEGEHWVRFNLHREEGWIVHVGDATGAGRCLPVGTELTAARVLLALTRMDAAGDWEPVETEAGGVAAIVELGEAMSVPNDGSAGVPGRVTEIPAGEAVPGDWKEERE